MKTQKILFAVLTAVTSVAVASANALPEASVKSLTKSFAKVPVAELSAKAATTVAQAPAKDREATAVAIVNAVLPRHSATLLPLITSISMTAPVVAPATAAAAAKLMPDQAVAIAVAASKVAPKQASKIAAAVAKAVPSQAAQIASAMIKANPAAADSIASAVATEVPLAAQAIAQQNPTVKLTRLTGSSGSLPIPVIGGNISISGGSISGQSPGPSGGPTPSPNPIPGADPARYNGP